MYGRWFAGGYLGQGLLGLVVECVGKFSLRGRGLTILFFCTIVAGFGLHREYEDSSSDLIHIM